MVAFDHAGNQRYGRLVIPRELRDRLGLRPGPVQLEADGANLRVRPIASDELAEADARLISR